MVCPHYAANKVGAGMQWLETTEAAIITEGKAREWAVEGEFTGWFWRWQDDLLSEVVVVEEISAATALWQSTEVWCDDDGRAIIGRRGVDKKCTCQGRKVNSVFLSRRRGRRGTLENGPGMHLLPQNPFPSPLKARSPGISGLPPSLLTFFRSPLIRTMCIYSRPTYLNPALAPISQPFKQTLEK